MNSADLLALSPFLVVAATPVLIMLMIAFYRNHFLTVLLTVTGLVLSLATIFLVSPMAPRRVTPLILVDGYALFFMALIFATSLLVALLSYGYLKKHGGDREEFYVLLLTATLGASVMVSNSHFASFFVGLETLNISLYALIAYPRKRLKAIEAGIKYLILAATSDAFLLFGMALVYAQVGTMDLSQLELLRNMSSTSPILLTGLGMLIVGIGFKLAVAPFHMWTPDVYEGAPAPVTAFIATVSKGAMFVVLFRYLTPSNVQVETPLVYSIQPHSDRVDVRRQSPGAATDQREAHSGIFIHRPHGLSAGGFSGERYDGYYCGQLLSGRVFCDYLGCFRGHHCALQQ